MFPSQFAYHRPHSVQEAVSLLQQDPDAKILAGGHSLLPAMKLRLAAPTALVDLAKVDELRGITANGGIRIGAMTTYRELYDSEALRRQFPMIPETIYVLGDLQVQSRGTIGGSLAHNDPAADLTAVVLALDGSVTAVGSGGERTIPADDFFVDLLTTSLQPDEIITQVTFPVPTGRTGMAYEKYRHPASGYAVVGVAVVLSFRDGDTCSSARVAVTGATSKPTRLTAIEDALTGQVVSSETIADAASTAGDGLDINGDHYASADYRRHLVGVYARRALEKAFDRA